MPRLLPQQALHLHAHTKSWIRSYTRPHDTYTVHTNNKSSFRRAAGKSASAGGWVGGWANGWWWVP